MFFCQECRSLFNITKDVGSKQSGGKINTYINNVFSKFDAGEKIVPDDLIKLKANDLFEDNRFDKMNKKNQEKFTNMITTIKNDFSKDDENSESESNKKIGSNKAYFICKFCRNNQEIKPGTLIYTKKFSSGSNNESEDYSHEIHDNTLPRTRNYICPNNKCETHKNISLNEAILTKNSTGRIVHICCQCRTNWIQTV